MTITFPMAHHYCMTDTAVHGQEIFKTMIQFPNHERSTVVRWSSMITSCIWPSTISTIRKRRRCLRRRTASASASIKLFCRIFIRLRSARSYMGTWRACRQIWTTGCGITIMSELIREKCAADERQWPRYLMENGSGQKRI